MNSLRRYLENDHRDIDSLLAQSVSGGRLNREGFEVMRGRLLRHIGIEEKIVLPAAREANGGVPLAFARTVRVEHGAIATLLVPSPDVQLVTELQQLLAQHDALEEREDGVYDVCDRLLAGRTDELAARAEAYPVVPTARAFDGPNTFRTAEGALAAAERIRFGSTER